MYLLQGYAVLCRYLHKELGLSFGVDNITNNFSSQVCAVITYGELFSTEVRNYEKIMKDDGNDTVLAYA